MSKPELLIFEIRADRPTAGPGFLSTRIPILPTQTKHVKVETSVKNGARRREAGKDEV